MPWYPSWIFIFWQLLSRGTCSCRSNKCGQFIAWAEYYYFTFTGNLMVNFMQKETQTQLLMWVSIFEWKGGGEGRCWWVTGIGLAFQVFSKFFLSISWSLGLEISSNLIESLFMGNKTTVWAKICGQNPHRGNKASVQISHLHICPYPLSPSKCWYLHYKHHMKASKRALKVDLRTQKRCAIILQFHQN